MIRYTCRVALVALAALFVVSQAQGQYFSAGMDNGAGTFIPTKINVLQWYDFNGSITPAVPAGAKTNANGVPMPYIQTWVSWSDYGTGSPSRNPWYGIDGSQNHAQINYGSNLPSNHGYYDIALPARVTINEIFTAFSHRPAAYTIWYSTTGFDNMKVLVATQTRTANSQTDLFAPKSVQYLRFEYHGTNTTSYIVMQEIKAFAADPTKISLGAGFNILCDPEINKIPVAMYSSNFSGANQVFNQNPSSMMNPTGSEGYFVKELGQTVSLTGASYGFYDDQRWTDMKIYVASELPGPTNDAVWTLVGWSNGNTGPAGSIRFGEYEEDEDGKLVLVDYKAAEDVRFIKVEGTFQSGNCAMIDLAFYAAPIPEPATMTLLALGGLALLRRRK